MGDTCFDNLLLQAQDLEMRLIQELEGHSDRVWTVSWNPASGSTGKPTMLASCSGDKTVRIWEHGPSHDPCSASWSCVAVLEEMHKRTVRSCEWSPDGRLLATASFDGTTAIWENVGGEFECVASLEGHENEVKSVSWNSSGTLLATCSRDKSVWIWEIQPGNEFECASVLQGHSQDVKMVVWHPFHDILVSASYDNSMKVWAEDRDTEDWGCVQTLGNPGRGHTSTVWAISFDSSGDRMVSCSDDLTLMIWDTSCNPSPNANDKNKLWKVVIKGQAGKEQQCKINCVDFLGDPMHLNLVMVCTLGRELLKGYLHHLFWMEAESTGLIFGLVTFKVETTFMILKFSMHPQTRDLEIFCQCQ